MKREKLGRLLLLLTLFFNTSLLFAKGFTLFKGGEVAQIYLSADEPTPLKIAAQHLQDDIELVTGVSPEIVHETSQLSGNVVILATQPHTSLTSTTSLDGLYQSYLMRPIKRPYKGVESALLVVGSDALGAVYGTYNLSEKIGVSPLYWYCDLVPQRKEEVVIADCVAEPHQPTVKYRGIFINDEEATIQWSKITSKDKSGGAITPETYKRVFELMLRLGANTLWPSMMEEGTYFFEAKDAEGVAINPKNATDYGIYVGTSHCENMARNNNAEWYDWADRNSELFSDDLHEFDYTVNPEAIEAYWRERLEESRHFNIIYTMGIRAVHDSEFKHRKMERPTLDNKVKLIQKVIDRQRKMIAEVFGSADAVPQIFVPYEEMAEFYNGETKNGEERCKGLVIPEDVIILSTDDNYGFLRQLPTPREVNRKGGSGVYYHLAYQGNPSPYDWLTTMPYKIMQQELNKLYNVGANSFWIVNVGDIKPSELGLQYFMDIAIDAEKHFAQDPREYLAKSATELFGLDEEGAEAFSDLFTRFCQAANVQKPDFMSAYWVVEFDRPSWIKFNYYSTADFNDEAERMIANFRAMETEARNIYDNLPTSRRNAFWHLAYYPIRSTRLMAEKSYYYYKNKIYAKQGRFASVNGYKFLSQQAADKIDKDLHYYNKELCGGKWEALIDPFAFYNIYERVVDDANIPKDLVYKEYFKPQAVEGIGSVCEGQVVGDERVDLLFSSLEENSRFIDIFNKGFAPQAWHIACGEPWVNCSMQEGKVSAEERVWVSIDWEKLPAGEARTEIEVRDNKGVVKRYPIVAHKITEKIAPRSYVEGAGFVAIEAEHYSKSRKGRDGSQWREVTDLGYSHSSMVVDGKAKVTNPTQGAVLEYNVYFTSAGKFNAIIYRIPTLNEGKGRSCQLAIGVNNKRPTVVDGIRRKEQSIKRTLANGSTLNSPWRAISFCQMERIPVAIEIDKPGYHTIKVYQMDNNIAFDRIVIPTTEQSYLAQTRSLVGAAESYNNINKGYKSPSAGAQAKLTATATRVNEYPELEPLLYGKFLFAKQGIPEYWGFTTVTTHHEYDKNSNLFGWKKGDIEKLSTRQVVGSRAIPYYRLFSHRANKPATFCATIREGNYEVLVFTGNITEYYSGAKGQEYDMTIKANGKVLVENQFVESDKPYLGRFDVKVGKDNLLEMEFSGKDAWGISVVEIYRK